MYRAIGAALLVVGAILLFFAFSASQSVGNDITRFFTGQFTERTMWLLAGGAESLLLEAMLETCKARGLVKARGKQRTDSTHVLAAIRTLNRLELVGETLRAALNSLATASPRWLRAWVPPEWFDRYAHRVEESRLPKGEPARYAHGEAIGADGFRLLEAVDHPEEPRWWPVSSIGTENRRMDHHAATSSSSLGFLSGRRRACRISFRGNSYRPSTLMCVAE